MTSQHKYWTFTLPLNRPDWVKECTRFHGTSLILVRPSGDQEIRPGETISLLDNEIIHDVPGAKS